MELLYSFIFSMSLMLIAWLIYCRLNNPGLIDVFWGLNITAIGLINVSARTFDLLAGMAVVLILAWGWRLSLFLLITRILKGQHDRRYEAISEDWQNKKIGFLWQHLFQGFLAWIIAMPFYTLSLVSGINILTIIAMLFVIIGIVAETIADQQLLNHKKKQSGQICQSGLWQYSRHPNYFFECLVWLGFSLMGLSMGMGLLSLISITTLFSIMWFVTIPITERESIKRRGAEYEAYRAKTSCFFPWPIKA